MLASQQSLFDRGLRPMLAVRFNTDPYFTCPTSISLGNAQECEMHIVIYIRTIEVWLELLS